MGEVDRAAAVRGKTIRFVWTEGPTKGKTHQHVFSEDGTVTWRDADTSKSEQPRSGAAANAKEKSQYAATMVTEGVYIVSYLAPSGYTLTVVLNFGDKQLVGFASSAKDWHPVRGTFDVAQ